jgi:uncharacterized protein (TIGR02598 family)
MRLETPRTYHAPAPLAGFSLPEVMVAFGVLGVMLVSLYAGIYSSFVRVRCSQENLRATQILSERMEVIRLYTWDQLINQPGYVPSVFTATYSGAPVDSAKSGDIIYTGAVSVVSAPVTESYSNDLRMVKFTLSWKSANLSHTRQMTSFVSQYGLQKYIY